MSSRRLISWLFALVLLLGQAAAFAHALSHLHVHDTNLPDKVCEVCVAQAQLGSGIPPSQLTLAPLPQSTTRLADVASALADLAPLPACARAPPAPSHS